MVTMSVRPVAGLVAQPTSAAPAAAELEDQEGRGIRRFLSANYTTPERSKWGPKKQGTDEQGHPPFSACLPRHKENRRMSPISVCPLSSVPNENGRRSAPSCATPVSAQAQPRRVLLAEAVDATAGVHDLLLARIERAAARAHFDLQVLPEGGARLENVPTAAGDGDRLVVGMDSRSSWSRSLG